MSELSHHTHKQLYTLVENGLLDAGQLATCEQRLKLTPEPRDWKLFLDRFALFLGASLLAIGILLFFAYNWAELGRFSKLGLLGGIILAAILLTHIKGYDSLAGKAGLVLASVVFGGLLATYGQIYQTGADPYSLFLGWAALSLGWVFLARMQALWFMTLMLANLALILYWGEYFQRSGFGHLFSAGNPLLRRFTSVFNIDLNQLLIIINFTVLILWETLLKRSANAETHRWACRVIASYIMIIMTQITMRMLFTRYNYAYPDSLSIALIYIVGTGGLISYYRWVRRDLYMIAISYLSLIITITSWAAPSLFRSAGAIFVLIIIVLVLSTLSAISLKQTALKWRQAHEAE